MRKGPKRFGLIKGLVALAVVGLLAFAAWSLWEKRDVSPPSPIKTNQQNPTESKSLDTIRITLLSATGAPIANTKVSIYSYDGTRCIQAPCPNNTKTWNGVTDGSGVVVVPKDSIQMVTTVTPDGYHGTALQYDATKTTYEVKFKK